MATDTNSRPWTWTPPPAMNAIMKTILRTPILHRLISKMILLLTFNGRKSGKQYTVPVGYLREGSTVTILTKRFRKWWHNFEEPLSVQVRIGGRNHSGMARALTDVETIIPIITHMMESMPREAEIYGVRMNGNEADPDSVREIAPKVVVIQIRLDQ